MLASLPDLPSLQALLQVLRENQVTSFKVEGLELSLLVSLDQAKAQPHPTQPGSTEPIDFTEDMPTDDELLFAASGFRPTE